jgi:hypothetical protein
MSEAGKMVAVYSNGLEGGSKRITRATQMMSIFGAGD